MKTDATAGTIVYALTVTHFYQHGCDKDWRETAHHEACEECQGHEATELIGIFSDRELAEQASYTCTRHALTWEPAICGADGSQRWQAFAGLHRDSYHWMYEIIPWHLNGQSVRWEDVRWEDD